MGDDESPCPAPPHTVAAPVPSAPHVAACQCLVVGEGGRDPGKAVGVVVDTGGKNQLDLEREIRTRLVTDILRLYLAGGAASLIT